MKALFTEKQLERIEWQYRDGLSAGEVLEMFDGKFKKPLSIATFRKYVQFGLLPRSFRVSSGGPRGSLGVYPPQVVRSIAEIKMALSKGISLEELAEKSAKSKHYCESCGQAVVA